MYRDILKNFIYFIKKSHMIIIYTYTHTYEMFYKKKYKSIRNFEMLFNISILD